jgi:hypothetical protein
VNEPYSAALAAVVKKPGYQELGFGRAASAQVADHVETVTPVGRRHVIEKDSLRRREPVIQLRPFIDSDAGMKVDPRPPDSGRPPASSQGRQLA